MKIIIDADACPVKEAVIDIASAHGIELLMICSIAHILPEYEKVIVRYVDNVSQAADMAIINEISPGDVVVTGDGGLAAIVLAKKGKAISFRGKIFKNSQMESILHQRYLSAKLRQKRVRTKGSKPFTKMDEDLFRNNLLLIINQKLDS